MPPSRPRPSEIAAEAKRIYMPHIAQTLIRDLVTAYLYPESQSIKISPDKRRQDRLRVAVVEGDPVDYAMGWYQYVATQDPAWNSMKRIPVVNMANEKRAGGDWESGAMAPEECFARRSNLVHALTMPWTPRASENFYPMPPNGGIYCPQVWVFRSGPDKNYALLKSMEWLPVISVAPVRRPKLDETGTRYSFAQEKEIMKEKMRTVLRLASYCGHTMICIGAFGVGPLFRNPVVEVARMWRSLLFEEDEFRGAFTDVVFAIDNTLSASTTKGSPTTLDVFRNEFDADALFPTTYR